MKEQNPMIIGGKVLQMTEENFELIKKRIDQVIYAEWAAVGAMGCSGTARVVIMEGEDLIEYVASAGKLYDAIYDLINDHSDKRWMAGMIPVGVVLDLQNGPMLPKKDAPEYFKSAYGGFGNYAWKNVKIKLIRDDSTHSFIFRKRGKNYRIKCSVIGVYNEVKAEFGADTSQDTVLYNNHYLSAANAKREIYDLVSSDNPSDIEKGYKLYNKCLAHGFISCRQFIDMLNVILDKWYRHSLRNEYRNKRIHILLLEGIKQRAATTSRYFINMTLTNRQWSIEEALSYLIGHKNYLMDYKQLEDVLVHWYFMDDPATTGLELLQKTVDIDYINTINLIERLREYGAEIDDKLVFASNYDIDSLFK